MAAVWSHVRWRAYAMKWSSREVGVEAAEVGGGASRQAKRCETNRALTFATCSFLWSHMLLLHDDEWIEFEILRRGQSAERGLYSVSGWQDTAGHLLRKGSVKWTSRYGHMINDRMRYVAACRDMPMFSQPPLSSPLSELPSFGSTLWHSNIHFKNMKYLR